MLAWLAHLFAENLSARQVDDLEEIGDLEGYIERSMTIVVYCSNGCACATVQSAASIAHA